MKFMKLTEVAISGGSLIHQPLSTCYLSTFFLLLLSLSFFLFSFSFFFKKEEWIGNVEAREWRARMLSYPFFSLLFFLCCSVFEGE